MEVINASQVCKNSTGKSGDERCAQRCCGRTQVRAEGMYISEKLDLLVQYLLVNPFQALFSRVFKREVCMLCAPVTARLPREKCRV